MISVFLNFEFWVTKILTKIYHTDIIWHQLSHTMYQLVNGKILGYKNIKSGGGYNYDTVSGLRSHPIESDYVSGLDQFKGPY